MFCGLVGVDGRVGRSIRQGLSLARPRWHDRPRCTAAAAWLSLLSLSRAGTAGAADDSSAAFFAACLLACLRGVRFRVDPCSSFWTCSLKGKGICMWLPEAVGV